jgi:hypothetical protein
MTTPQYPAGVKVQNVSNLAAFGIHYTTPGSDVLHGLTGLRGTEHLSYDTKIDGRWHSVTVVNPERFTKGYDIDSPKRWAAVVEAWFASFTSAPDQVDADGTGPVTS